MSNMEEAKKKKKKKKTKGYAGPIGGLLGVNLVKAPAAMESSVNIWGEPIAEQSPEEPGEDKEVKRIEKVGKERKRRARKCKYGRDPVTGKCRKKGAKQKSVEFQPVAMPESLDPWGFPVNEDLEYTSKQIDWAKNGVEGIGFYDIDPMEFLLLTVENERELEGIINRAGEVEDYNSPEYQKDYAVHPFLSIDSDGNIDGHEGRHRAAALLNDGEEVYRIVLVARESGWANKGYGWRWKRNLPLPKVLKSQFGSYTHQVDDSDFTRIEREEEMGRAIGENLPPRDPGYDGLSKESSRIKHKVHNQIATPRGNGEPIRFGEDYDSWADAHPTRSMATTRIPIEIPDDVEEAEWKHHMADRDLEKEKAKIDQLARVLEDYESQYGKVTDIKKYYDDPGTGMMAIDVYVIIPNEGQRVYHIDYEEKHGYRWLDFGVEVKLGDTLEEAIDGFEVMLQEGAPTQELGRKK